MIFRQAGRHTRRRELGRVAQKQRTRNDLLRAARALREAGCVPTVAEVADTAGVSRATAYRHFPTQEMLLAEATAAPLIDAVAAAVERASSISDPVRRVDVIFAALVPTLLKHETELRALLKIVLERSLREAQSRNVPLLSEKWVAAWDAALAPLRKRLSPKRYALMVRSLSTLLSVEAIMVLRDACDLDDRCTIEVIRRAARAMTLGFLSEYSIRRRTR